MGERLKKIGKKTLEISGGLFWALVASAIWELAIVPNLPHHANTDGTGGGDASWHVDFSKAGWDESFEDQGGFHIQQGLFPVLTPTLQAPYNGGSMKFFKFETTDDVEEKFVFVPMSASNSDVVLQVDHILRCIIGDGDYRNVRCQKNLKYPLTNASWQDLKESSGREIRYLANGLEPNKEVSVHLDTETEIATDKMRLKLQVTGFRRGFSQSTMFPEFVYDVQLPFPVRNTNLKYGFGILGSNEEPDQSFSPKVFDLREKLP